jgi:hypothetical protein
VLDSFEHVVEHIEITEVNHDIYKDVVCSICIGELQVGDISYKLACSHYFHQECIKEWIVRQ